MGVIPKKTTRMGVIPEKTTPLTKFIRTGEGVLVFAFNLTMLIVPIVSNSLSPEDAVKWAGIVNGVAVISRTGLKVVAEFSKATGIEPQPIGNLSGQVVSADSGSTASDGAPEVVTGPSEPVVVVTGPTDPVVDDAGPAGPGEPSDDEEFASIPTADDDAVDVPVSPVPSAGGPAADDDAVDVPASPVPSASGATADDDAVEAPASPVPSSVQAPDTPEAVVSDEEEFSSVPPPGEDDDDVDVSEPDGDGAVAEGVEPAMVAVPTDPVVTDGGGGHLS